MVVSMTPEQARDAILAGTAPDGLRVEGSLHLYGSYHPGGRAQMDLRRLPADLEVTSLSLSSLGELRTLPKGLRCDDLTIRDSAITHLPDDLQVRNDLTLRGCPYLAALPYGLRVRKLSVTRCERLKRFPTGIEIAKRLEIRECAHLEALPDQLMMRSVVIEQCPALRAIALDVGGAVRTLAARRCENLEYLGPARLETLDLSGCVALRELPEGLRVRNLIIAGCVALERWPRSGIAGVRTLDMSGCRRLTTLLPGVTEYETLDIRDCVALEPLPARLRVTHWLDVGGLDLRALPISARGFRLRWRGAPINGRALFHPETITAIEALNEENAEARRALIERMGFERLIAGANATLIHEDSDAGGPRQLLELPLSGDENLRCLAVRDPSTGRQYMIRVPPWMRTCHQAAAWIAGFDNPDAYQPVAET